jgi:Na+-driven multidrug efflux pump
MAGTLGEVALAAHVTIQNFSFFYFPLPFSVSMAGTIRIGNLLGAGNPDLAVLVTKVSLCVTNLVRKAFLRNFFVVRTFLGSLHSLRSSPG